jgi:GNAT superfamily N-acetyltransferase
MIRAAMRADAPAIGEMHAQAWAETYPGLVPDGLLAEMTDASRRRAAWAANLAAPRLPGGVLLLEQGGAVLGFVAVCATRDTALGAAGEVAGLYLLRRAQGQRLGAALLRAGAKVLRDAGFTDAGAWALDANTRATGFYAAQGAVPGHRQMGFHGPHPLPETAWVLRDLSRLAASA